MPLTALGGDAGTVTVGDVTLGLFPQPLHPNVMAYVAAQTANGYSPSRERVDALNNLVWGLVGSGLWDKCDVIYPFLGGTTGAAQKWNIKNVADTTAAFTINWVLPSNITFSESGVQSNATAGTYGNTFYTPNINQANTSSVHLSAYMNTLTTLSPSVIMGSGAAGQPAHQIARITGGAFIFGNANASNSQYMQGLAPSTGFYMPVRTGATTNAFYRNGVNVASTNTNAGVSVPTVPIWLLNRSGLGGASPMNGKIAFASLGAGMTAQQARDFYTIVQTYQTALGRQV